MPDNVVTVSYNAFANCSNLSSVKLSKSLETLSYEAFYDCDKITEIEIPKSLTDGGEYGGIAGGAFNKCSGLKQVTFEKGTTKVAKYLFANCDGLEEIVLPDTITSIGENAFYMYNGSDYANSSNLKTVTFSENLVSIGEYAFYNCRKLASVELPEKVETLGYDVFNNCINLSSVKLSDKIQVIPTEAFAYCKSLTDINFPTSLTKINDSAFYQCKALVSVNIPVGVTTLGKTVFYDCEALENVVLPDGLTSMGTECFRECSLLEKVTIGKGLKAIPMGTFRGTFVDNIVIPDTVTKINDYAFGECVNLKKITIPKSVTSISTNNVFSYPKKMTIYGIAGSYAETYANEKGITFEEIAVHKHSPEQTYTSDKTGHWHKCTTCNEKVDFAAHISDNGTITKQPTEQTEGEKTYKCTVCGYVIRTEPIAKLDHKHVLDTNWTSDATGHWHNCTGCSEKVDFAAHTEDSGTVTKQPTMTEEGEKTYKCKVCGYVIRTEAVSKLSDSAVAVYDGTETKTFDDLDTALKAYKTTTNALTITLNKDANVKTLALPTKAGSITFTGTGALNVSGTSITIPANTTFDVEVNGKGKTLAVKVSAGKKLDINNKTSNIGAVSGTKTSTLNINEDAEALSIATFGTVNVEDGKTLTVTSRLSAVTNLNGAVKLPTAKTTAATVTAGNAEIILTDGNIAKVTLTDVTNKLNVKVVNENGETTDLSSGTIVLYSTKDISEKVTVENTTADQKELNAFYYKKNKAVKAEWADAVTLYNGETSRNFPNVELVLANITDKNTDYTITLNTDVTEPRFILPKTAKSITINGTGSLTTAVTNIAVPVDTTIGCEIKQSANKAIALRSAANTTLTLSAENSFGAMSGTRTSKLNVNENAEITSIATFDSVNVAENKTLTVTSKLSAVTSLNGAVKLPTAKTTAATVTAGNAEIILTNDDIAKVTLADVTNKLNVKVVDESNEAVKLASGTIVLYSTKDISEKTTIENITSDDKELNAFYYKKNKAIKAEWADAITLSYSDTGRKFPNMELALESITDRNTDYTITLNTDITASTFALPAAARSVTIKSENEAKTITLTNIAAVSAKTPLTLENIKLESTKPYTISTTYDLTLDRFASDSITAVKGGAKATLTLGETTPIDKVSGFGTTKVTSEFRTGTMFTTTDLELTETANLVVSNTKAPATAKTLNGAEGSVITIDTNFTPIKVTGTTADSISGTIKLKATEAIDENTVLFTTKYAGNNVFDVTEIQPQTELDYTVTSISGKAYMKPIVFEMNETGYALWTDVMTVIENVKMSEAQYTVKLLDSTNINGALKLPKAGTYGKLTISSESKTLTFTGSITATGELEIANTNLVSARNTTSSKYTISAGKYQFAAENADLSLASITSTADVTLKNIRTSGTVRAGKLTLNGTNTILGTITANELGSTEEGTVLNILSNTRGVMSITKNGISENSEEITIKLVDESENAVTAENLSIIASSFTGNYSGELKLSTENGEFSIILSRNKLVLADSFTAANGLLEADEEESDDTDTSEKEPAEETPEDNSDDDPSEEDAPNDGDTSDNDINEETESSDTTEELSA